MEFRRKPEWIRSRLPGFGHFKEVRSILKDLHLHTVCESALCPNLGECWGERSATIMIMGDICTRNCRFCSVKKGRPFSLDSEEPLKVALAIKELGLEYAVITSVDRDDLPDFGGGHFAETVRRIKEISPDTKVEVLIPDFNLNMDSLKKVIDSKPDVIAHNVETVKRLTPLVRDKRAGYEKSLTVLKKIKEISPDMVTKSGIMIGLGEMEDEITEAMKDIKDTGCEIITIGQYLRPTRKNLPVERYYTPEEFKKFERIGYKLGFKFVASGVFVRSSYRAKAGYERVMLGGSPGQEPSYPG